MSGARRPGRRILEWATLATSVAAIIVAAWVPYRIDQDAWHRQRQAACLDAVVELRSSVSTLVAGYRVSAEPADRLGDWERGQLGIDRVRVSCGPHLDAALAERGRQLWALYQTAREDAARGGWDGTNAGQILTWTADAIERLTTPG